MGDYNWEILVFAIVFLVISFFVAWGVGNCIAKDREDTSGFNTKLLIFVVSIILLWTGYGIALVT